MSHFSSHCYTRTLSPVPLRLQHQYHSGSDVFFRFQYWIWQRCGGLVLKRGGWRLVLVFGYIISSETVMRWFLFFLFSFFFWNWGFAKMMTWRLLISWHKTHLLRQLQTKFKLNTKICASCKKNYNSAIVTS